MAIMENDKSCCGCRACEEVCPKKAIVFRSDKESFMYPIIDHDSCINCGMCEDVCPLNYENFRGTDNILAFVGKSNSDEVNYRSSSGGAFTALYETYLSKGYIVCGVKYQGHLQVVHDFAGSSVECEDFRKSKYVQSNTNGCFSKVAGHLEKGNGVLFSGVSCQVAALNAFLNLRKICTDRLVTVNLICHGVPSQALFDAYIEEEEKKQASSVLQYQFKNKQEKNGKVNSRTAKIEFSNGNTYIRDMEDDAFLRGYYNRLFYRPSCGTCRFSRQERISDFTIADAWGIQKVMPEYDPLEGISLILFNSEKAREVIADICSRMTLREVPSAWALTSQGLFRKPTAMHKNRDLFFSLWKKIGFKKAVYRCTKPSVMRRFIRMLPGKLKDSLKKMVVLLQKLIRRLF